MLTFLAWYPAVVYMCCGVPMDFEALPRACYVCGTCGDTR